MFERDELETKIKNNDFPNSDILGDMVISIERVQGQAIEYGHSFERELSYMVVHSFSHFFFVLFFFGTCLETNFSAT